MTTMEDRFLVNPSLRIFLTVGVLGGFTTFSSFSYETISLLRDGEVFKGGLYVVLSVALCLGGTHLGSLIGKFIV